MATSEQKSERDLGEPSVADLRFALEAERARAESFEQRWRTERSARERIEYECRQVLDERDGLKARLDAMLASEAWRFGSRMTSVLLPAVNTARRLRQQKSGSSAGMVELLGDSHRVATGPLVSVVIADPGVDLPLPLREQSMPRWEALGYRQGEVVWSEPGSRTFDGKKTVMGDALQEALARSIAPFVAVVVGEFPDDPLLLERAVMRLVLRPDLRSVSVEGWSSVVVRRRGTHGDAVALAGESVLAAGDERSAAEVLHGVAWLFPRNLRRCVVMVGADNDTLLAYAKASEATGRFVAYVTTGTTETDSLGRYHYRVETLLPRGLWATFGVSLLRRCRDPIFVLTGDWLSCHELVPSNARQILVVTSLEQAIQLADISDHRRVVTPTPAITAYLRSRGIEAVTIGLDGSEWTELLDEVAHPR
jgi:hypothetical protein